jgi:hypothetical protein
VDSNWQDQVPGAWEMGEGKCMLRICLPVNWEVHLPSLRGRFVHEVGG